MFQPMITLSAEIGSFSVEPIVSRHKLWLIGVLLYISGSGEGQIYFSV
jgi:hypothetical protein